MKLAGRAPWLDGLMGAGAAALVIYALSSYAPFVAQPGELWDEAFYLCGFRAVAAGASPYTCRAFMYPPGFAVAGALSLDLIGLRATQWLLRLGNLAGAGAAAAVAVVFLRTRPALRALAGAALFALSPSVSRGLGLGNISGLAAGLVLGGLALWPRRTVLAGLLLGAAGACKPLGVVALAVLFFHRPALPTRRHQTAAGLALALTALSVVPWIGWLPAMLASGAQANPAFSNLSWHRVLMYFGVTLPPLWLLVVAIIGGVAVVRRRRFDPVSVLCIGASASLIALPIVWRHTLVFALPFEALGIEAAVRRLSFWRRAQALDRQVRPPVGELLLIALCPILVMLLHEGGVVATLRVPDWASGIINGLAASAPALLTYLIVRARD